jgi:hypothetical protein
MTRPELSDEQFERLQVLLPSERPRTGRPTKDLRRTVLAIL